MLGLEHLGPTPDQAEAIRRLCRLPQGFVAVVGPSGSGKTTVLYSLLLELLQREGPHANLMTIEDPVEFAIDGLSQLSVNRSAGLTFASLLREVFRIGDPDIIAVWELPDRETSELTFHVASAGHLMLAQESVNSAVGVIQYLREQGLDPYLIARSFAGSIGVRLVRRVCDRCATPDRPAGEVLSRLGLSADEGTFRRGVGCPECRGTGYRRRIGLFEVLEADDAFRRLLARDTSPDDLWRAAFSAGGSLWERARELARAGVSTVEEIDRAMGDYPHPVHER